MGLFWNRRATYFAFMFMKQMGLRTTCSGETWQDLSKHVVFCLVSILPMENCHLDPFGKDAPFPDATNLMNIVGIHICLCICSYIWYPCTLQNSLLQVAIHFYHEISECCVDHYGPCFRASFDLGELYIYIHVYIYTYTHYTIMDI